MSLQKPAQTSTLLMAPLAGGIVWPCAVRASARVKRAKMSVNAQGFVELILPSNLAYSDKELEDFLHSMLPWLQKTLDKLVSRQDQSARAASCLQEMTGTLSKDILPPQVFVPLWGQKWLVQLSPKLGGYAKLIEEAPQKMPTLDAFHLSPDLNFTPSEAPSYTGRLILHAHDTEMSACCRLLQKWLVKKAALPLRMRTLALAEKMGVQVAQVRVAAQRGRWGSCSVQGNINLNGRLLLLPRHLVDHVILHELCHRVHMNHSSAFKKLLESVSPQSKEKDKELSLAWQNLPLWALTS